MKELENVMIKLEKVTKKKEQMDNQIMLSMTIRFVNGINF